MAYQIGGVKGLSYVTVTLAAGFLGIKIRWARELGVPERTPSTG